ncbi:hypothetical protein J2D78_00375 [Microbacterium maritypicum]|nr:hypothetical protein [Microbacterium liquefaciens]
MVLGREQNLAVAESVVRSGGSIDVVGGRFSGRSAFLSALRTRLENHEWNVVSVRGVASLRQHGLAAMHLAGLGGPSDPRLGSTLQTTADALREATRAPRSVLFLDDWDDLDESSWGVAESVRRTTGLPIVLSRLLGLRARHTPSGLTASTLEPSYVIEMVPIRFDELEQVLREHLEGPVETSTMSRIYAKSGGIIGLALSLVDSARRESRLVNTPGGWVAVRDLWTPGLNGVVEGHLENLGQDARDALEIIALVGVADVETVRKLISWETLELLEERAMVELVASGSRQLVSVVPALLVEFFRHQPLAARRIRLTELIMERLGAESPVNVLIANSALSSDVGEGDALFVRLLQERARTRSIVSRVEWTENPKPRTAVQYVHALLQIADGRNFVADVFAKTDSSIGDSSGRAEFVVMRAEWRALVLNDLDGALDDLSSSREGLDDYARVLDATAVRLETMMREVPVDFASLLELDDALPDAVRLVLKETQLLVLITLGRFKDAHRVFASIPERHSTNVSSRANQLFGWVLLGEGAFDDAVQWSSRGLDEAHGLLDADATFNHGYLLALCGVFQGDYAMTHEVLDTLFAIGEPSPLLVHTDVALLCIASVVAFREGNSALGERYLTEAEAVGFVGLNMPGQNPLWPRAQLSAFNGSPQAAAAEMWRAGVLQWKAGGRFSAAVALLTSAEIVVTDEQLDQMKAMLHEVDGEFVHAYLRFLIARHTRDAACLVAEAEALANTGRSGLALNSLKLAIEVASHDQRQDLVDEAEESKAALLLKLGNRGVDTRRFLVSSVTLTEREMEIAQLVATGLANPEIATRLVVSVRTVESHLHRILRKTSLANRAELIAYIRGLESHLPAPGY